MMNYWEHVHHFTHNGDRWYFTPAINTAEAGRLETANRVLFIPYTASARHSSPYRWLLDSYEKKTHKTPIWKGFPQK